MAADTDTTDLAGEVTESLERLLDALGKDEEEEAA